MVPVPTWNSPWSSRPATLSRTLCGSVRAEHRPQVKLRIAFGPHEFGFEGRWSQRCERERRVAASHEVFARLEYQMRQRTHQLKEPSCHSNSVRKSRNHNGRLVPVCQVGQDLRHAPGKSGAHLAAESQKSVPEESNFLCALQAAQTRNT